MSPDIQTTSLKLQHHFSDEKSEHSQADTYYAEYKDLSKKELIAVCVRFIFNGNLRERERAVGFVATDNMTFSCIASKFLEVQERCSWILNSIVCGFQF